jgi:hypothetical protein
MWIRSSVTFTQTNGFVAVDPANPLQIGGGSVVIGDRLTFGEEGSGLFTRPGTLILTDGSFRVAGDLQVGVAPPRCWSLPASGRR